MSAKNPVRRTIIALTIATVALSNVLLSTAQVSAAHFTHGYVTSTTYLSRAETRDLASSATAAGACAIIMKGVPEPLGLLAGGACYIGVAGLVIQANRAEHRNMCLKLKFVPTPGVGANVVIIPDIYRGAYCR